MRILDDKTKHACAVAFRRGWTHGASGKKRNDGVFRGVTVVHDMYIKGYRTGRSVRLGTLQELYQALEYEPKGDMALEVQPVGG